MKKYQFDPVRQNLLEQMPIALAIYQFIDQRVITILLSDGFLKQFGYEREEGMRLMDHDMYRDTMEEDIAAIANEAYRFATEDGEYDVVYRAKNASKDHYIIVHAQGRHVYMEDGTRLALVWYINEGIYDETDTDDLHLIQGTVKPGQEVLNDVYQILLQRRTDVQGEYYDKLTGLPNMNYFIPMAESARHKAPDPAVLFADLSGMKRYNEKYGFTEGNRLITEFSDVLKRHFDNERCARIGADHFTIYVDDCQGVEEICRKIFQEAVAINSGKSLPVRIGIYRFASEDVDIGTASDRAKIACDSEKNIYESSFIWFDESFLKWQVQKSYVLDNFERALQEEMIQVYYQPIVRNVTGEVCDEEALSRWIDKQRGILSPAEFIPVLEDAGLLYKLDLYVIEHVLKDMKTKKAEGIRVVPVSVNLSWYDFQHLDMVEEISRRMDGHGIPRHMLNVEITESVVGKNPDYMRLQIERFHQAGFNVWMDDFGSGYSSLDVLQNFEFDLLKFDMQFMRDFGSRKNKIIMTQLAQMAIKLGIDTIAEGVENSQQIQFLREIGIDRIQGYYYSKPNPLYEVIRRYREGVGIGFEDVDTSEYYNVISKTNLIDPGITKDNNEYSETYYNAVPMGIIECLDGTYRALRYNPTFAMILESDMGVVIPEVIKRGEYAEMKPTEQFIKAAETASETGDWAYIENEHVKETVLNSFIRQLAVNPVTGARAMLVIVLSVI